MLVKARDTNKSHVFSTVYCYNHGFKCFVLRPQLIKPGNRNDHHLFGTVNMSLFNRLFKPDERQKYWKISHL